MPSHSTELARVVAFLQHIGLPVEVVTQLEAPGFMDRVRIHHGGLRVQDGAAVADVLHEAGHLAVVPAVYRAWFSDDVEVGIARMLDATESLDPDDPLAKAAMQAGESEATAWAWAAGAHLGLPPETIIEDHDYQGAGPSLRTALAQGCDPGVRGLCRAGFCGQGTLGRQRGLPIYPTLAFWLQGGPALAETPTQVESANPKRPKP